MADGTNTEVDKKTEVEDDLVNPWEVKAGSNTGVDYDKIIGEFLWKIFS